MIVVVESISAAGKTTWCRKHLAEFLIAETFPADRHSQPNEGDEVARYWTDWNAKRWGDAIGMEKRFGLAACDTDPLKLHYLWSLVRIGEAPQAQWEKQVQVTRQAFSERRLGFADLYLVKLIDPIVARHQRDNDQSRSRERFDLHVRLQPPLMEWYRALEMVLGGFVLWELPEKLPDIMRFERNPKRHDLDVFDGLVDLISTRAVSQRLDD